MLHLNSAMNKSSVMETPPPPRTSGGPEPSDRFKQDGENDTDETILRQHHRKQHTKHLHQAEFADQWKDFQLDRQDILPGFIA